MAGLVLIFVLVRHYSRTASPSNEEIELRSLPPSIQEEPNYREWVNVAARA